MKKQLLFVGAFLLSVFFVQTVSAQRITSSVMIGWASGQGDAFNDQDGERMVGFGLMGDADLMYHFTPKVSAGVTMNGNILFGISKSNIEIGIWGLDLYGLKGEYRLFESTVSPYAGLGLGLSRFGVPEMTITTTVDGKETETTYPEEKGTSLGLRPELGVYFGGFKISAAYIVPMKYEVYDEKLSAGVFQISLGGRWTWWSDDF